METYEKYCSVNSYPFFYIWEGNVYCADCANSFAQQEEESKPPEEERIFSRPQDAGISPCINWEASDLYCSSLHGCGEHIESAYHNHWLREEND